MAIQNKHSINFGSVPNLLPGEIALNLAEEVLWVRIDGRRTPIPLRTLYNRGVPTEGQTGAPLAFADFEMFWSSQLAAAAVVDGKIEDDLPPEPGLYRCPGSWLTGAHTTYGTAANEVLVESFNVRSDQIRVDHLTFSITGEAGPARVGLVDAEGTVLCDVLVESPAPGANVVPVLVDLPRGTYRTVLWTAVSTSVILAKALQPEQGWDLNGDGLTFSLGARGIEDLSAGLSVPTILTQRLSSDPGVERAVLMRWRGDFAVTPLTLEPGTLEGTEEKQLYVATLVASHGTTPYVYAVTNGALPDGINLNSATGELNGYPTTPGRYGFTITVTDAAGETRSRSYMIPITKIPYVPPVFLLDYFTPDQTKSPGTHTFTMTVSGGLPPYSYQWAADGVSVVSISDDHAYDVTSTATVVFDTYDWETFPNTISCTATDFWGQTVFASSVTSIYTPTPLPITLTPLTIDNVEEQSVLDVTLEANGGIPPYTYALTGGALPPGVTFNPTTARLYGVPTTPGNYSVTFTVTDSIDYMLSRTYAIKITVKPPPPVLRLEFFTPNQTRASGWSSNTIQVSGGVAPYHYSWSASGPAYQSISPDNSHSLTSTALVLWDDGALAPGNYSNIVRCTAFDAVGQSVSASSVVSISVPEPPPPPPFFLTSSFPTYDIPARGGAGQFSAAITVSGGTPPYSFAWGFNGRYIDAVQDGIDSGTASFRRIYWHAPAYPTSSDGAGGAYFCTVTDARGQTVFDAGAVGQQLYVPPPPPPPPPSLYVIDQTPDQTIRGGGWAFSCIIGGGVPPYFYSWSAGGPSVTVQGGIQGSYIVHFSHSGSADNPEVNDVSFTVSDTNGASVSGGCNVFCYR